MEGAEAILELKTRSPEETLRLGEVFGSLLPPGALIALTGELGAGKTVFTKGLARGLGIGDEREVTSPSFVLVNEYQGRVPIYHLDLYRLPEPAGAEEVEELGWTEFLGGPGVTIVEWAERAAELLPQDRIDLDIRWAGFAERIFYFVGRGPGGAETVRRLTEKWHKEE
jgi:tRNA threonylcarbamoyladenosine biosynthesis protein TsaE